MSLSLEELDLARLGMEMRFWPHLTLVQALKEGVK